MLKRLLDDHFAIQLLPLLTAPSHKYNKFFDSISIRYPYKRQERHLWYPERDEPVDVNVTNETTTSTSAGLSVAVAGSIPVPAPEVHVQKDRKLTVARKMRSRRKGVSMEKCELCLHKYPLPSTCKLS